MQGSPAAFPFGMPGMGELIEGAVQQAPQLDRHCIRNNLACKQSDVNVKSCRFFYKTILEKVILEYRNHGS